MASVVDSSGSMATSCDRASAKHFSAAYVAGQKRLSILCSGNPVWRSFRNVIPARPQTILFGQEGPIILRGGRRGESRQRLAVVPGHPFRRLLFQLLGVLLQLSQIVERIGPVQLAGVDQTHEQIADSRAVQRPIEE